MKAAQIILFFITMGVLSLITRNSSACETKGEDCAWDWECCSDTCQNGKCTRKVWYNYPQKAKLKITRDANGQSWLYLEFDWPKPDPDNPNCSANFEQGKAVEFEFNIRPKCFLRPRGGKDDDYRCRFIMGEGNYSLPDYYIPGVGRNCYIDVWNYTNPTDLTDEEYIQRLESSCGDLSALGEYYALEGLKSGAFLDEIGTFAVGLHDASALNKGGKFSIRYPVEVNTDCLDDSGYSVGPGEEPTPEYTYIHDVGAHCASPFPIYATSEDVHYPVDIRNDWGRVWVTMQTFNNKCDLPGDASFTQYTCPELIGIDSENYSCYDVDKYTDYWISRVCAPTGDWDFTPGYGTVLDDNNDKCIKPDVERMSDGKCCATEYNSSDMRNHDACCIDRDGDGYFSNANPSSNWSQIVTIERYGTHVGDCNDDNASISPAAVEVCGDGIDNNCDGFSKNICIGGGGSCPQGSECETGDQVKVLCPDGINEEHKVCNDSCEWEVVSECPPGGSSCQPGTQQQCGNCGTMTCNSNGQWGSCLNQGVCSPGATQNQTCNDVGTQTKTCNSNCTWGGWGACSAECTPGDHQQQQCNGGTGTQTRDCNLNGTWTSWSTCIPSCQCSSGTCCDGCNYKSAANSCDLWYEYQCEGSSPGQDVERRQMKQYCSGSSSSCNGQITTGGWQTWDDCSTSQECQVIGSTPQCVGVCQDTFLTSSSSACSSNPQGAGNPTLCLYIQQNSGSSWKYQICKQGGSFQNSFKYQLKDENHLVNFTEYTASSGTTCTPWKNFSVSYITGYGAINGAGLVGHVTSPSSCSQSSCKYKTGGITICKECQ